MTNKAVSRIAIAFLCFVGLCLLVFIGFMAIIVIACGQYKPPVHDEEDVVESADSLYYSGEESMDEEAIIADFSEVEAE